MVIKKNHNVDRIDINESEPAKTVVPNRHYAKDVEMDHDLYKLEVAKFKKNISWEEGVEQLIDIEHCHMFHTYDSNGRKMVSCNFVGGHDHEVKPYMDSEGNLHADCGPARSKVLSDKHVHKVSYQKSDKIRPRKMNAEAVKAYGQYATPIKFAPSASE